MDRDVSAQHSVTEEACTKAITQLVLNWENASKESVNHYDRIQLDKHYTDAFTNLISTCNRWS